MGGEKRERDERQPATVISGKVLRERESDWEWVGCGGGVICSEPAMEHWTRQAGRTVWRRSVGTLCIKFRRAA